MASVEPIVPASNDNQTSPEQSSHHIPDNEGGIHFTPPLYRQRYLFTLDVIQRDPTLYSLLDIGCGTCQLLTIGKYRNPHIQLTAAIDIVRHELDEACFRLKPLPVEFVVFRRETPLHMYVLHGDATKICNCFQQFDVVTLIEVVEHLYLPDLERLVEHVFAYIRPRLVIVTTPNADFNVLFSAMPCGQFRHADHKFEFTRQQFSSWAQQIALTYNYLVEFSGVGEAPAKEQHRNIGPCTQIALFYRQDKSLSSSLTSSVLFQRLSYCQNHEVVSLIDYPHGVRQSTDLQEQVRYILEMYRLMAEDKARHGDESHETFPLTVSCQTLLNHPRLLQFKLTLDELEKVVEHTGCKMIDHDRIVLSEHPPTNSREDYYDDEDDQYSTDPSSQVIENTRECDDQEECWD